MTDTSIGILCTDDTSAQRFLARVFDRNRQTFTFPRESRLWDAVESAQNAGKFGRDRTVAVLDTDFDLSPGRLASVAIRSRSEVGPNVFGHGTAVALLINEIAPEAQLWLRDVRPGAYLHASNVERAIRAVAGQADVINMSLGFASDAKRRVGSVLDADLLFDSNADPRALVAMLVGQLQAGGFFEPGGCTTGCRICAAIHDAGRSVVVAAAGNQLGAFCPAAHDGCVGTGFQPELRDSSGVVARNVTLVPTFDQSVYAEMLVAQPEGFEATSFAAPLISGLVALDDSAGDLARLVSALPALTSVQIRHERFLELMRSDAPYSYNVGGLVECYQTVLLQLPASHQHWSDVQSPPCATCAVLLLDAYNGLALAYLAAERFGDALAWCQAGLRVCPLSVDLLMNHGAILRAIAGTRQSDDALRAYDSAMDCYAMAAKRRPSDRSHGRRCAQLIEEINAARGTVA